MIIKINLECFYFLLFIIILEINRLMLIIFMNFVRLILKKGGWVGLGVRGVEY